ncbi:serine hydrolase domain-containing protein [Niameybacter massiliensis]|uniref:serine hydrolase domain-containing protein n=1 Tax=Niameybacter massiliensis TaxID=1658108 RepID=UPI0006B4F204|nr:serine hydrolase [Niameybacter massiliensis]
MKKIFMIGLLMVVVAVITVGVIYGDTLLLVYRSINAFEEKNLAHSFQTMYEIQPSTKISKSESVSKFEYDLVPMIDTFEFRGEKLVTDKFLEETKTSGLLVVANNKIAYENYYLGAGENTRFSSNSVCKSFTSALVGIAIEEGYIDSVEDSIGKYIEAFKDTEMEKITIKDCLQMSSGIDFDEVSDMSKISMTSMFGVSKMKSIVKFGLAHEPGTNRTYSSINTDILGEIVSNATGKSLSKYMEEKIWSQIGVENDAYWTLSNNKELANGGLHISLRDYARFGRLYMNDGVFEGKQIIPKNWIKDSVETNAPQLKAPKDGKPYSELGYGYQWWIPEGDENEFMAIGVFGQWIYINPDKEVIIVKTGADSKFEEDDKEKKTVAFFRAITKAVSNQ